MGYVVEDCIVYVTRELGTVVLNLTVASKPNGLVNVGGRPLLMLTKSSSSYHNQKSIYLYVPNILKIVFKIQYWLITSASLGDAPIGETTVPLKAG